MLLSCHFCLINKPLNHSTPFLQVQRTKVSSPKITVAFTLFAQQMISGCCHSQNRTTWSVCDLFWKFTYGKSFTLHDTLNNICSPDPLIQYILLNIFEVALNTGLNRGNCTLQTDDSEHLWRLSGIHSGYKKSGLWLGNSKTLIIFFWSHSFVDLDLWFRSLLSWNVK